MIHMIDIISASFNTVHIYAKCSTSKFQTGKFN